MKVEHVETEKLIPYARNAKKHDAAQVSSIAASVKEFGFNNPVLIDKDNGIIAGHGRVLAAQKLGLACVPCIRLGHLTENQKRAYILADNRLSETGGGWDSEMLKLEFGAIDWGDLPEFNLDDLGDFGIGDSKKEKAIGSENLNGSLVAQLKDNAQFPGCGKFDIPELREDSMMSFCDIDGVVLFDPNKKNEQPAMWNYNSDSTRLLDFEKCVVSFYVEDVRFECMWNETAGRISAFVNRKILGMITPNFSTYFNWPGAMRMWNIFRSRWIGRYAQESGIKIIPDISCAPGDVDYAFDGIPQNAPCSIQIHRERPENAKEKNIVIDAMIEIINPSFLLVYGQQEKARTYPSLDKLKCVWVEPRSSRMKQIKAANK